MAEKSSYFDKYNDLPQYTAQDAAERTSDLIGKKTGYIAGNREELLVSVSGTTVYLHPGAALIEGRLYVNDNNKPFTVGLCASGKTRIDRVILKLDTAVESLSISSYIKQGEEGVSDITAPELTQSGTIFEISVAQLSITDTAITIIDERDSEFCGKIYTANQVIEALSSYIPISAIVNDLITGGAAVPLSAEMGKTLNGVYGYNGNGEYFRFENGLLICFIRQTYTTQAITSAYGSSGLYTGTKVWTFPHLFLEGTIPVCLCTELKWGSGASWPVTNVSPSNSQTTFTVMDILSRATGTSTKFAAVAIGRWQ